MSENFGGRHPEDDGNKPDQGQYGGQGAGSANEAPQQWGNQETQPFQASSAPEAPQQWGGQDTQSFQASSAPEAGQSPYNPNSTQQFQAQGYDQGETQAFGASQYGQGQNYNTQQYNPGQEYGQGNYGQQYSQENSQNQYGGSYGQTPASYPPSQPSYGNQYGQDTYGGGYGGQPPYGGGYGQPPNKGKGPLIAWIVLGVILIAAVVVGILFATGVIGGDSSDEKTTGAESSESTETGPETTEPQTTDPETTEPGGDETTSSGSNRGSYGSDPELDALYDACGGGDMAACDELYYSSGYGTEYEEFANTCGGTETDNAYGTCELGNLVGDVTGTPEGRGNSYGDDAALDELYDGCEGGDLAACDELYWDSPIGSEYEDFATTCGGRTDYAAATCEMKEEAGLL